MNDVDPNVKALSHVAPIQTGTSLGSSQQSVCANFGRCYHPFRAAINQVMFASRGISLAVPQLALNPCDAGSSGIVHCCIRWGSRPFVGQPAVVATCRMTRCT